MALQFGFKRHHLFGPEGRQQRAEGTIQRLLQRGIAQQRPSGFGRNRQSPERFFIQRIDLNAAPLVLLRNEEHLGTPLPALLNRHVVITQLANQT